MQCLQIDCTQQFTQQKEISTDKQNRWRFFHYVSRGRVVYDLRVGLHALGDAQGTHIVACELLGQQGKQPYGAALQGSTLALDVASQHVAEEAHLAHLFNDLTPEV